MICFFCNVKIDENVKTAKPARWNEFVESSSVNAVNIKIVESFFIQRIHATIAGKTKIELELAVVAKKHD